MILTITKGKPQASSCQVYQKKLIFYQISKLRTQSAFKNIKVIAHSDYHNESTQAKRSIPLTCPSFSRNSEKFWRLQG